MKVQYSQLTEQFKPVYLPYNYSQVNAKLPPVALCDLDVLLDHLLESKKILEEQRKAHTAKFDEWMKFKICRTAPGYLHSTKLLVPTKVVK